MAPTAKTATDDATEGDQVDDGTSAEDRDDVDDADEGDEEGEEDDEPKEYRTVVVVERKGGFRHPVTVALEFDDGEVIRHEWDGQNRWTKIVETRPAKLVSAEVDPDHLLALDVNRLNNGRRLEPDRRVSSKMLVHVLFWFQNLLELTAIVG